VTSEGTTGETKRRAEEGRAEEESGSRVRGWRAHACDSTCTTPSTHPPVLPRAGSVGWRGGKRTAGRLVPAEPLTDARDGARVVLLDVADVVDVLGVLVRAGDRDHLPIELPSQAQGVRGAALPSPERGRECGMCAIARCPWARLLRAGPLSRRVLCGPRRGWSGVRCRRPSIRVQSVQEVCRGVQRVCRGREPPRRRQSSRARRAA
jgi:hypothetical protein